MPTQTQEQGQTEAFEVNQFSADMTYQLEQLKIQQARLKLFQSDLDLLKKQYELNPGWFTKAAQWYQQQSWYEKLTLKVQVTVLALGLGILISGLALIIVAGAYFALTYLFDDHNKAEKRRRESLCKNIVELEQDLQANIQSFTRLQSKFLDLCQAVQERHTALASCFATLSKESDQLQEQIRQLVDAIHQNNHQAKELDAEMHTFDTQIHQQQEQFQQVFDKAGKHLLEQQTIDTADSHSVTIMKQDVAKLDQAITRLEQELVQQEQLTDTHILRCETLELGITQAKASMQELDNDHPTSVEAEPSQKLLEEADEVFQQTETLHEYARRALKNARVHKQKAPDITMHPSASSNF